MPLERLHLNLRHLVEHTLGLLQNSAEEKGVALSLEVANGLAAYYYGDRLRLQQARLFMPLMRRSFAPFFILLVTPRLSHTHSITCLCADHY